MGELKTKNMNDSGHSYHQGGGIKTELSALQLLSVIPVSLYVLRWTSGLLREALTPCP